MLFRSTFVRGFGSFQVVSGRFRPFQEILGYFRLFWAIFGHFPTLFMSGRVKRGTCVRLYSRARFACLDIFPPPDMTNKPLDGIMLKMYEMNIDHQSPRALLNKCMNPPEFNHVNLTLKKLEKVKALDIPSDTITKLGNGLNNFGLDPQLAKIIIYRVVLQKCHENGQNKVFRGLNPLPKLGYFKNQIFFSLKYR